MPLKLLQLLSACKLVNSDDLGRLGEWMEFSNNNSVSVSPYCSLTLYCRYQWNDMTTIINGPRHKTNVLLSSTSYHSGWLSQLKWWIHVTAWPEIQAHIPLHFSLSFNEINFIHVKFWSLHSHYLGGEFQVSKNSKPPGILVHNCFKRACVSSLGYEW